MKQFNYLAKIRGYGMASLASEPMGDVMNGKYEQDYLNKLKFIDDLKHQKNEEA